MADNWILGESAALDDYIPNAPTNILGDAAQGVKDWYTSQPSWLDRAKAENQKTLEAYGRGGMGEIAKQLATDTTEPQELYGAFGVGNVKGVRPPVVPGALAATSEYRPPFYSAVEQAVQGARQNAAPGQQWAGFLRNQPGVKPEEVEALKLGRLFEQPGSVPKEAVLGEIAANRVNVGEVYKGGDRPTTFSVSSAGNLSGAPALRMDFATAAEANAELASRQASHPGGYHSMAELPTPESRTKFEQYTLPGGENYREMLLTLPQKGREQGAVAADFARQMREKYGEQWSAKLAPQESAQYDALISAQEKAEAGSIFKSSHYDEPNILAHVRYNDRVIDGKKTLFVEEVQSDWHQAGKRQGYKDSGRYEELLNKYRGGRTTEAEVEELNRLNTAQAEGVPDAPFKTTWPELAMKRIIREAAEKGYDKVAWTPGSVQAERYDLSRHVDGIDVFPRTDARTGEQTRSALIRMPNGNNISIGINKDGIIDNVGASNTGMKGKPLDEVLGKDVAEKIMKVEGRGSLFDVDLKIGGEGMKGFYDEILPATVNKLIKKHGGRVQQSEINAGGRLLNETEAMPGRPAGVRAHERGGGYTITLDGSDTTWGLFGDERAARARMSALQEAWDKAKTPVHTLDITPQLRAQAMKGFPLFTAGGVAATGIMGEMARQDEYR